MKALIIQGGWEGHEPATVAQFFAEALRAEGYTVDVADTLGVFDDAEALAGYDLISPCWTMGTLTPEQSANLSKAIQAGTGLGGFHGGMGDAFRGDLDYEWMVGGHFVGHPHVGEYTVQVVNSTHPITKGLPESFIKQIGIGIIGCGKISQAYFEGAKAFDMLNIVACADLNPTVAQAKAAENGCQALSIEALLAHPDIQIVINLTIPAAHAAVSRDVLNAGKHVYCEKPLTVDLDNAREVLALAESKGLLVGCAPDTFFGAGIQTSREIVDSGKLGRITSGTVFMLSAGHESWHPNPGFYYLKGGGPVLDMAPYYLTALVNLLGPVKSVSACTSRSGPERVATCNERKGEILPVEVNTHASGTLLFHSGAVITAVFSFDVVAAKHSPIELYGTNGSIQVPDPNTFGGPVSSFIRGDEAWTEHSLTRPYSENMRGIGAADMARSILSGRPHRASGALACHVLEVMHAFDQSSETGSAVKIQSHVARPAALPEGLLEGELD